MWKKIPAENTGLGTAQTKGSDQSGLMDCGRRWPAEVLVTRTSGVRLYLYIDEYKTTLQCTAREHRNLDQKDLDLV